jgi:hypothetical protein
MQIANGTVILCPENHQFKHGVTPAEALILFKMHRQNANGSPIGEFFIQPGEAQTVEVAEKPATEREWNQNTGLHTEGKPAVPAVTHKRTNAEEVARLKKKYTGVIDAQPAFIATFGGAAGVRLPETFAELEEIGHLFKEQAAPSAGDKVVLTRKLELLGKTRAALCDMAIPLSIKVHSQDSKESIVNAIVEAEEAKAQPPVE